MLWRLITFGGGVLFHSPKGFLYRISCYSTSKLDSMETDKLLMENEAVVVKTEVLETEDNLFVSNPKL